MNIKITDAYENNLKHIDLSIPKNKLIVFTGLSGSGKSTLAMETLLQAVAVKSVKGQVNCLCQCTFCPMLK